MTSSKLRPVVAGYRICSLSRLSGPMTNSERQVRGRPAESLGGWTSFSSHSVDLNKQSIKVSIVHVQSNFGHSCPFEQARRGNGMIADWHCISPNVIDVASSVAKGQGASNENFLGRDCMNIRPCNFGRWQVVGLHTPQIGSAYFSTLIIVSGRG